MRRRFLIPTLLLLPTASAQDIHEAAATGDIGRVRALLGARPDLVRRTDELQRLALHVAARHGHREVVALLLEKGPGLEHAAYNGFTPLMLAAAFNRRTTVELLIERGAKVDATSSFGDTALEQAADRGHHDLVRLLVRKGARYSLAAAVAIADLPGCKAALRKDPKAARHWKHIWSAARRGHVAIAKLLLDHGAPTETEIEGQGQVPLLVPGIGHHGIVKALIDAGAELDVAVHHYKGVSPGSTPLLIAAMRGHTKSAEVLLAHKCDPHTTTAQGWNTLHCAASGGHVELVGTFLKVGVNARQRAEGGWTPMMLAASGMNPSKTLAKERGRLRQVIDALTGHGVETDLYTAVCIGHGKRVRELLAQKPWPERPPERDLDALLLKSVKFGHTQIVDLLCANGADPNQMEESGYTALHWAAFWNRVDAAKVLLDRGADPNAMGRNRFTALHEAARLGSVKVAALLIHAGAKVHAKDNQGKTPIQWVTEFGDSAGVRALLEKHTTKKKKR